MASLHRASRALEKSLSSLPFRGPTVSAMGSQDSRRPVSSSGASLHPQLTSSLHQQHQQDQTSTPSISFEAAKPYSEIPKTKTFLGLNMKVLRDPYHMERHMIQMRDELGPIFRFTGLPGLPDILTVVDPKDMETAFRVGDSSYPRRFPFKEWIQARKELNRPLGIFLADGEDWHKQRTPVSKFIMMPRKMAEYYEPFNNVTLEYVDLVRTLRQKDDVLLDVTDSLNKWSVESISLFVLGKRMGCLQDQMPQECRDFVDNAHEFNLISNDMMFGIPYHKLWRTKKWKRLVSLMDAIYSYIKGNVDQKIERIEDRNAGDDKEAELGMDFLTYMICSGKLSVPDIAMDAIDLLGAGVDTTAMTMAACLYSLGRHGEVQEKLRREVQDVVGKEELVTPQHIQDMHYLRDVIKETMRLYPIVLSNTRYMDQDVVLSGYKVPAGTLVIMPIIASGTDPKFFSDPYAFKPERWDRNNEQHLNPFLSLPFSYGRRSCVGRRVAELEMHILLSQLVRNFRIEYRDEKPMEFVTKLFHGPARRLDLAFSDI